MICGWLVWFSRLGAGSGLFFGTASELCTASLLNLKRFQEVFCNVLRPCQVGLSPSGCFFRLVSLSRLAQGAPPERAAHGCPARVGSGCAPKLSDVGLWFKSVFGSLLERMYFKQLGKFIYFQQLGKAMLLVANSSGVLSWVVFCSGPGSYFFNWLSTSCPRGPVLSGQPSL